MMESNLNQLIVDNKDASVFGGSNTPKMQRELIKINKEYLYDLSVGYINAIDAMIDHLNSVEVETSVRNKIMMLMTSLVLDDEDVEYLRTEPAFAEEGDAIPSLTEIAYVNDIPFEFDIIEAIYIYLFKIAKDNGFMENNGIFGNLDLSGIILANSKDYRETYQSYIVGLDGAIQDESTKKLAQKISDLCRANNAIRDRMLRLMNNGKKPSKKEELDFRRKYKLDTAKGSFELRLHGNQPKPISKTVFALIAKKNDVVYSELKKLLK